MTRSHRTRVCALLVATACGFAATITAGMTAGADDPGLVQSAEWNPFPKDTAGHGYLAVDDEAQVGYAFSGTNIQSVVWDRVQAFDLRTGRPISAITPIRTLPSRAPVIVDSKRRVLVYAETHPSNHTGPFASHLVGIALRGKEIKEVFRVPSPLGAYRIAGMSYDDAGQDLVILGTLDGAGVGGFDGSSLVQLHRVQLSGLLNNTLRSRWNQPVEIPAGVCPTPMQTYQPAGVLVSRESVWIGCRGSTNFVTGTNGQNLTGATGLILRMDGLGAKPTPAPAYRIFRMPGNFTVSGESIADDRTRRFVTIESSGYIGLRAFDTDHSRFVGRINAGQQSIYGVTVDRLTSRAYFISHDETIGVGYGDLASLVPTQGERVANPYSGLISNGTSRRLSFDSRTRRLFIPMRRLSDTGAQEEYLLVLKDRSDPYVAPEAYDPARGTVDMVDKEGVTESSIASTARGYGVDYQLIGGTANIVQNIFADARGQARPGSRHLRAGYVKSGSLTGDGALAYATLAEEDSTTDQDRHGVTAPSPAPSDITAGSSFAPVAECSDYGAGKTEATKPGASVLCDLSKETTRANATFRGDDALLVTVPQNGREAPVRLPVQVSRAYTEVVEHRAPNRGALTTTVTAVAEGITIADVATIGRVSHKITVTAHGRSRTADAKREISIVGVTVEGKDLCGTQCHPKNVEDAIDKALDGRGGIEFPTAEVFKDPRGTYAEVTQDPWYHAERVGDYDKANDDYVVPVMSVELRMDSTSKSRLLVDFAGAVATASYRVFKAEDVDFGGSGGDWGGGEVVRPQPSPARTVVRSYVPPPTVTDTPPAQVAQEDPGLVQGLVDRLALSLRSLREAFPLVLVWTLLAVPAYLSARRRLLLELPMLTRDEELT